MRAKLKRAFNIAMSMTLTMVTTLSISLVMGVGSTAQARNLNWNELQECIYLRSDIEEVRTEQALDRQAQNLPPLLKTFDRECVKGRTVAKRDFDVVCSISVNYESNYCAYWRERFALHNKAARN